MSVAAPPRLVLAAPSSGAGKTAATTGLLAALAGRGYAASGHKVGPDYIDPGYHALACARPPRNLDPVLTGEHRVLPLFLHGARGADVAVVEGVLGLFDGRGGGEQGSTAQVARLLAAPVVLVVDAAAASRSVAAVVHGFATFDPAVRLAGVILNRVGSPGHEEGLRAALAPLGLPVLGALPRDPAALVPSRHLGLVPAGELAGGAARAVARLGELAERHLDLDALLALARAAPALAGTAWDPETELALPPGGPRPAGPHPGGTGAAGVGAAGEPLSAGAPVRVAVAGGAAFTFGYTETLELLRAAGAEPVVVDPLVDTALPPGAGGLLLGGGFPEVHAADLAGNLELRAAIAAHARRGGAISAECAGLLYLARELDGAPMCAVLPASARMTPRLELGYRDAVGGGAFAGLAVTGHEFHRTQVSPAAGADQGWAPAWTLSGGAGGPARPEGFARGRVHASYLHVHPAGAPELVARFVRAARSASAGAVRPGELAGVRR